MLTFRYFVITFFVLIFFESVILNFLRGLTGMGHPFHHLIMFFDLCLFIFFFIFRKDFCCPAGRGNRRQTCALILLSVAGVIVNIGITWHSKMINLSISVILLMASCLTVPSVIPLLSTAIRSAKMKTFRPSWLNSKVSAKTQHTTSFFLD